MCPPETVRDLLCQGVADTGRVAAAFQQSHQSHGLAEGAWMQRQILSRLLGAISPHSAFILKQDWVLLRRDPCFFPLPPCSDPHPGRHRCAEVFQYSITRHGCHRRVQLSPLGRRWSSGGVCRSNLLPCLVTSPPTCSRIVAKKPADVFPVECCSGKRFRSGSIIENIQGGGPTKKKS